MTPRRWCLCIGILWELCVFPLHTSWTSPPLIKGRTNRINLIAPVTGCEDETETSYRTEGDVTHYVPQCFARPYYFEGDAEGLFLDGTKRPLPFMGKTCGNFKILVVFFDTETNRSLLSANLEGHPEYQIDYTNPEDSLEVFFSLFTPARIFQERSVTPPVSFQFAIEILSYNNSGELADALATDPGLINSWERYDAVLFLEDLGVFSGYGIGRWPFRHPIFSDLYPQVFRINPRDIAPGLFYNELFRRNVPQFLAEYLLGAELCEEIRGFNLCSRSIMNQRTGGEIDLREVDMAAYFNGWMDVDNDGITDCQDPFIRATPDNVDADLIPDFLDPDLTKDNGPFFWKRRSAIEASTNIFLEWPILPF